MYFEFIYTYFTYIYNQLEFLKFIIEDLIFQHKNLLVYIQLVYTLCI